MMKSIFSSKTFWANIVALLAMIAGLYGVELSKEEQELIVEAIAAILPVLNIVLRFMTREPVRINKN